MEKKCPTCNESVSDHGHLCVPVKKDDKVCDWCGSLILDNRHLCKEKIKSLSYICNSCGRTAVDAGSLCNPEKIQ